MSYAKLMFVAVFALPVLVHAAGDFTPATPNTAGAIADQKKLATQPEAAIAGTDDTLDFDCGRSVRPLDKDGGYAFWCYVKGANQKVETGVFAVTKAGAFFTPVEAAAYGVGVRTSMKVGDKTYYALLNLEPQIGLVLAAVSDNADFKGGQTSWADKLPLKGDTIAPTIVTGKTRKIAPDDQDAQRILARIKTIR